MMNSPKRPFRWVWRSALGLIAILAAAATGLNCSSVRPDNLGSQANGKLLDCPGSPNCVASHQEGTEHGVDPLPDRWEGLKTYLASTRGATVIDESSTYIRAEFRIPLFRFVDDVEFLRDEAAGTIQVRSSSRVGHSDLGVNRRRVERIRKALSATPDP